MTTGHLNVVQLAEHAEGLLEPQHADAIEAHLNTCDGCRQSATALEAVTARLAMAPPELPTPPDVVDRLDRALAAERTHAAGGAGAEPDAAPVVQLGWFRRRAPQLLAAAATIGVLGFAGYAIATSGFGGADSGAMEIATDDSADEPDEDAAERDASAADEEAAATLEEDAGAPAPDQADEPSDLAVGSAFEPEVRELVGRVHAGAEVGAEPGCGRALADELGRELVGSAPTAVTGEDAVLVVVEVTDSIVEGWVLPTCDASISDALDEPRLVSID
jgi:hypothetical protein